MSGSKCSECNAEFVLSQQRYEMLANKSSTVNWKAGHFQVLCSGCAIRAGLELVAMSVNSQNNEPDESRLGKDGSPVIVEASSSYTGGSGPFSKGTRGGERVFRESKTRS